jgi:glucose dehydrogenase
MNLAGSLAIFVVGFALVFVRLEAKVFVLLAAILGTIVAGMFWPEAMVNWLAAARMGVAAVIALWLVVFLLRVRRTSPFQAAAAGVGTVLLSTVAGSAATMPPGPPPPHVDQPSAPDEPSQSSPSDHSSNPQQEGGANESQ